MQQTVPTREKILLTFLEKKKIKISKDKEKLYISPVNAR